MIIDGQVKHPAKDGTYHDSWFAAWRRSLAYSTFMATYDGRPESCGYSWDKKTGKPIDHHKGFGK